MEEFNVQQSPFDGPQGQETRQQVPQPNGRKRNAPPEFQEGPEDSQGEDEGGPARVDEGDIPNQGEPGDEPATELTPVPDDPHRKRKLQVIIRGYKLRFGDRLEDVDFESAKGASIEELESMLADIRFLVSCTSSGGIFQSIANVGVVAVEHISAEALELKTQGLAVTLKNDQEWKDLVDEWALEHADVASMPIEYRLGFKLVQSVWTMHTINTNLANAAPPNHRPVDAKTVAAFSSL